MSSLRHQAARGVSWTSASSVILSLLQVGQIAVLTRFLDPSDFGLRALVTVVVGFVTAYADMGMGNAVVHRQEISDDQLSSLYWLNIGISILAYGLVLALMPAIVWFYDEPRLYGLIPLGGATFVINAFYGIHAKLLEKELRFDSLAIAEIIANVAGAATAIVMAILGYGVLSLIIGQIVTFIVRGIGIHILYRGAWRPRFVFRMHLIRSFLSFGLYQTAERSVSFFSRNLDKLILGRVLGQEALGYYSVAFNLVLMPISRINPLLTRVAFPVLSRVQNDERRLRQGYLFVVRFLGFINFPLLIGLMVVADIFAPLFLGPEWTSAIIIIQVLSVVAILRSVGNPVNALLLAKGKVKLGFWFNAIKVLVQIPLIYSGALFYGLTGVLVAVFAVQLLTAIANYRFLIRPTIGVKPGQFFAELAPSLVMSVVMGVTTWLAMSLALSRVTILNLVLLILLGIGVYGVQMFMFQRGYLKELARLVRPGN